jgi:antiviral helicase SKI2
MIDQSLKQLSPSDRELPQIKRVSEMLKRGIGLHHSGLLPLVKELVEMVFSKGLVKVLFATETFAMGVNMPTKTVVFNGLRKFDGKQFRDLTPGEYTQMAGRAGRRGLDSFGTVIINCPDNEIPDESPTHQMILGKPTRLTSQFRLTYNMIVNLMRVEDLRVEDMIKRSFFEFDSQKDVPEKKKLLKEGEMELEATAANDKIDCIYDQPFLIDDYYESYDSTLQNNAWMMRFFVNSKYGKKYLTPGRVLSVSKLNLVERPAIILDVKPIDSTTTLFQVMISTPAGWKPDPGTRKILASESPPAILGKDYLVTIARSSNLMAVADNVINVNPKSITLDAKPAEIARVLSSLHNLEQGVEELYFLDYVEDIHIDELDFYDHYQEWAKHSALMESSACNQCPKLDAHFEKAEKKFRLKQRVSSLRWALSEDNVEMIGDFKQRVAVLQDLKYISSERAVQLKGRVACEINTCESLIATEMIFENVITPLTPEESVAILSCFIFQQKTEDKLTLSENLSNAFKKILEIAANLADLQKKFGIDVSPENFILSNLNPGLMEVVFEWAKGTPFCEICKLTTVEEGVIVRCITRLDETCRDFRNAARVIGDPKLYQKMELGSSLIKRDIVFAASLYVA